MIDVALHGRNGPVNLATISQRQQVSLSHLEQLFARLRRHGLAASTRGPGGGYSLGRKATDISVADIILAIDDEALQLPRRADEAEAEGRYATDELWASVNRCALDFLDAITLQSLVDEQLARGLQPAPRQTQRRGSGRMVATAPIAPSKPTGPNSVFALGRMATKGS